MFLKNTIHAKRKRNKTKETKLDTRKEKREKRK